MLVIYVVFILDGFSSATERQEKIVNSVQYFTSIDCNESTFLFLKIDISPHLTYGKKNK